MKRLNMLFIGILVLFCAGCTAVKKTQQPMQYYTPQCRHETTVAIYDAQGSYTVPGCVDYYMPWEEDDRPVGDFPAVENNKYPQNQVVLQNLNTRVLAYCRGTEEQVAYCLSRLEGSCYVRLSEVPKVTAKADELQRGTYPTRRWREGDVVPRW